MGAVNDILEKIVPLAQKYIEEERLGLRVAIDKSIVTLGYMKESKLHLAKSEVENNES